MKNSITRLLAITLAAVIFFGLIAPSQMSAAAATQSIPNDISILCNEGTNRCVNNLSGKTSPGTKTTLWSFSNKDTDLWLRFVPQTGGGYKVFDHELKTVVVDVNRGTNTKVKPAKGMKIATWPDQKSENDYQIFLFERTTNGSYILRLKANPNLALGITKNKNGAQLQIVAYNKADATQRWFICNTNGKKLTQSQIEGTSLPTSAPSGIGSSSYKKTGVVYTVSNLPYTQVQLTTDYNGVPVGTKFYLDSASKVVRDQDTLKCLETMELFSVMSQVYVSNVTAWSEASEIYYDLSNYDLLVKKLGSLGGKSLGIALNVVAGNALALEDAMVEVTGEVGSPETYKTIVVMGILRTYANNCGVYASNTIVQLSEGVVAYEDMMVCLDNYSKAAACFAVCDNLVGDDIRDMASSSTFAQLVDYGWETILGLSDAIIPDFAPAEIAKFATDGVVSLADFATKAGCESVFQKKVQECKSWLPKVTGTSLKGVADQLMQKDSTSIQAFQNKLNQLKGIYKPGNRQYYFKNANAYQCHGFACEALMLIWGTPKPTPSNKQYTYFKATSSKSYVDKIRPGDMVRYRNGNYDHTIVITEVDDDYVYYCDCNADGNCTFAYNKKMAKTKLDTLLKKKLLDSTVSTKGYVCHYKNNPL